MFPIRIILWNRWKDFLYNLGNLTFLFLKFFLPIVRFCVKGLFYFLERYRPFWFWSIVFLTTDCKCGLTTALFGTNSFISMFSLFFFLDNGLLTESFWVITINTSLVLLTPTHYFLGLVDT